MNNTYPLTDHPITHANLRTIEHPRYGSGFHARSAVRYMRFMRHVSIDRLLLPPNVYGRFVPRVPTHPAHITVSVLDKSTLRWDIVQDLELPPNPRIMGEGLSQDMSINEVEAYFANLLQDPPLVIQLDGLETDHLRIECDREHRVWPCHGECNGGEYDVPYGILKPITAYGTELEELHRANYNPILVQGQIDPSAAPGMQVIERPEMLLWKGNYLSVGFSLRRPMIMHMGWDVAGQKASENRINAKRLPTAPEMAIAGYSGPLLRGLDFDFGCQQWTGNVSVKGNTITYTNLHCFNGLTIDAAFTVEPDNIKLNLNWDSDNRIPVLESELWRFIWNLKSGITGAAALPTQEDGRSGRVHLPMMWASDGVGCLSVSFDPDSRIKTDYQVESYREQSSLTGGFSPSINGKGVGCDYIESGNGSITANVHLDDFSPENATEQESVIQRYWSTPFACFRSEYRGFSNHSASTNCHLSQCVPIEVVAHTAKPENGPDPIKLAQFTLKYAMLDGGGYGYHRNLYMDSDPILVAAVGRVHSAQPDIDWLQSIKPGLDETVNRILGTLNDSGLAVCRALSGNSGSFRWSTNSMDIIGSGHLDAYINALTYRALRSAHALEAVLGDGHLSDLCGNMADKLLSSYSREFVNPETGWVAGWRSRDGQLHDYAFLWINGVAIAFGLLPEDQARTALTNLENLRDKVGLGDARLGLPLNLLPIDPQDHMLPKIAGGIAPTFETYTDGSLSPWTAIYYLRALSIYGLHERAHKLINDLEQGLEYGLYTGGDGTGPEFRSWEGMPTGYEGTLIGCMGFLYSIAVERGLISPSNPEWWPKVK